MLMDTFFDSISKVLHEMEAYHDSHTLKHEFRTGKLMSLLAHQLSYDDQFCQTLADVGAIHDIGKTAIPAHILEKPSKLSKYEREAIELHPQIGYNIVKKIKHPLGELAAIITLTHHESFDGSGYPKGLKGKEIPLTGRICRLCDVYDALRTYRPYRETQSNHESVIQLMLSKGKNGMLNHFDPELLNAFVAIPREQYELIYSA